MGKRITQQARGKGSLTFRVRPRAYRHRISYPPYSTEGKGRIIKLFNSSGHSSPLIEIEIENNSNSERDKDINSTSKGNTSKARAGEDGQSDLEATKKFTNNKIRFIIPAADGIYEGQEIYIGIRPENKDPEIGDILKLKDIKQGIKVFNVESIPGNGGRYFRSAGSSAIVMNRDDKVELQIRRRKLKFHENCRAVIGVASGDGRLIKPLVKAGKQHHIKKAQGRKWHRTSAVKVNAVDHPFGGGRGKRIKSKIAKRNAPPGRKVGHIRPRKTGRKR